MNRKNLLAMCVAGAMTSMITTTVSQASDIEIYQQAKSGDITLMFMLDVSTSMNATDGLSETRWQRVQVAMRDLLNGNSAKKIEKLGDDKIIGLSTLGAISFNDQGNLNSGSNSSRGAVLVPARRLDAQVTENGVTKTQRQLLVERVNKIVMRTSTPTAKSYAEVIAYLMGVSTNVSGTNSGWDYSHSTTKKDNKYESPASLTQTNEIKKCSGQGIYVLTDGQPNSNDGVSTLASVAINKAGFSCTSSSDGWACTNKMNEALINPNLNGKGLKFKTAVVGFGNSFNSIASYDKNKTQAENIAALGTINTHEKFAARWGILGEGGWYAGSKSEDVVKSVNEFINSLATDIPSVTTGTPSIPVDELNTTIVQNYAYFPQFQPTPDKLYQLWLGNMKKYNVKSNGLTDKNNTKIADNKGKLIANYDLWSPAVSTNQVIKEADVDTIGSEKFALMGGARSQLLLQAAATSTKVVNRKLLTNRVVTGSGTSVAISQNITLQPIELDYLTKASYKDDPQRGYLMNLLGYAIDPTAVANVTLANLRTSAVLRQVGAVMHSSPILITNKGKITYNETTGVTGSSNREDYILFGSTQGLLHVVDAESGVEKFAFVPNEMVQNQKEAFTVPAAQTGGMTSLHYGIDGPWTTYTEYVLSSSDDLTVAKGKNNQEGKQIAYGGLRMGGKSYYALDLADIDNPKMLFHIDPVNKKIYNSGSTTGKTVNELQYMGQSWSKPAIAWVRWNGVRKRVMFVGGGYDAEGINSTKTNQKAGDKYRGYEYDNYAQTNGIGGGVYMFDADNGDLLLWSSAKATTTAESAAITGYKNDNLQYSVVSEIKTVDRDSDGLTDHLYFGDLGGQVFRMDLNNALGVGNKTKFLTRAVKILNLNNGEASPRFFEMPSFSIYDYNGQPFGVLSIGSGNRSLPLIDYTTGSTYQHDSIYNVYDKDVARKDLFTTTITLNTPDRTTVGNNLIEITDADRFSTATLKAPQSQSGWYYQFKSFKQQSEKVLSTPIVIKNDMFVSTFDGSKPGLSGDCGAGVKGESFTTLFCMPYGQCPNGSKDSHRLSVGAGITAAAIGAQTDGETRVIVANVDASGGTGGSAILNKEYKATNSLVVQRWYEKL